MEFVFFKVKGLLTVNPPLNFAPLPSFLGGRGHLLRNGTSQISEWSEQKNDFSKNGTINKIFDDLCVRENINFAYELAYPLKKLSTPMHAVQLISFRYT